MLLTLSVCVESNALRKCSINPRFVPRRSKALFVSISGDQVRPTPLYAVRLWVIYTDMFLNHQTAGKNPRRISESLSRRRARPCRILSVDTARESGAEVLFDADGLCWGPFNLTPVFTPYVPHPNSCGYTSFRPVSGLVCVGAYYDISSRCAMPDASLVRARRWCTTCSKIRSSGRIRYRVTALLSSTQTCNCIGITSTTL